MKNPHLRQTLEIKVIWPPAANGERLFHRRSRDTIGQRSHYGSHFSSLYRGLYCI